MDEDRGHPHLLLWYVSGDLDPAQARETEAHLVKCRDCTAEARALASTLKNLRQSRSPGFADLTADGPVVEAPRRESALPTSTSRSPERRRNRWRWPALTAITAAVVMPLIAIPAWIGSQDDLTPHGIMRGVQSVVLSPPLRGSGGAKVLAGEGPWVISVVLPFGAPAGNYELRIDSVDQPAHPVLNATLQADAEGRISVIVESLPRPGRFVMSVRPRDDAATSPYIYAFQTVAAPKEGA